MTIGKKCKTDSVKNVKRFELTLTLDIRDNRDGKLYQVDAVHNHPRELCDLLNEINARADRNAELVDMGTINLMFELDRHKKVVKELSRILDKYEIDSLEKLDLILMEQRVW